LRGASEAAGRLRAAWPMPSVVVSEPLISSISTHGPLEAGRGERPVGRARALYLAEKAEDGTQRQREIAGRPLQRHTLFYPQSLRCFLEADIAVS